MEKLAKIFGHDFKEGDFKLFDKNKNQIYYENSDGYWFKKEYDEDGNEIYFKNLDGYWTKIKYNKNNNEIYYENSDGFWLKREYDKNGNEIYREDSYGSITDNRPKTCINKEIIIDGKKYKLVENKT